MKILKLTTLGICLVGAAVWAESADATTGEISPEAKDENSTKELVSWNRSPISISGRVGAFDWKDSEFVDSSFGAQMEARIGLGDTPFDIVFRGYGASVEYDDFVAYGSEVFPYKGATVLDEEALEFNNMEASVIGGSFQLQLNLCRDKEFNPYIAAGAMYEKTEIETDYVYVRQTTMKYKWLTGRWVSGETGKFEMSENGSAFIGRVGFEWKPAPKFYVRAEAGYLTKLYDDPEEKAQAELNAIVGCHVTNNVRLDVAATYFTEWEEYYLTVGATILFF